MAQFFHGTSSENLHSIMENGLVGGINLTENRTKNTDVVFLTTNYQSAVGYAGRSRTKVGGTAIILVINSTKARSWKNKKGCTIFIVKNVPAEEIVEIKKL